MRRIPRLPLRSHARPCVEALEDRCLLAANVLQTNLVSDLAGVAEVQDTNVVNPWGLAETATSPLWLSNNGSGHSTLYQIPGANGSPIDVKPLIVSIPAPDNPLYSGGSPTGIVANLDGGPTGGFKVSGVDKNGAALSAASGFLFATEDGTIVGWSPNVNPKGFDPAKAGTYGIIAVDNSKTPNAANASVYKGLTMAASPTSKPIFSGDPNSTFALYAANFRSGQIDVFDTAFKAVTLPKGAFTDPNLPKGYAPFNVQLLGGKIYVTYAKQDSAKHDDVAGPGNGFVDGYNLDGSGGQRLISRGPLNSPWGLALAPAGFGPLAGDLLVGNFGNGVIHLFNPATGQLVTLSGDALGLVLDPDGEPIQIPGLWALRVGNGAQGGDANTLYFTAGLGHEGHGLFGSLVPVASGTPEGPAEEQLTLAAIEIFQIAQATVLNDFLNHVPRDQLRQDLHAQQVAFNDLAQVARQFERDESREGWTENGKALQEILDAIFAEFHRP